MFKRTFVFLLAALAVIAWPFVVEENSIEVPEVTTTSTRAFAGGNGTVGSPYKISNVTQLQWMGNTSDLDKHFVLANDIDASATKTWNAGAGFMPIGTDANRFTGSLNGCNRTITGLFIDRPSTNCTGLFGYLGGGAVVKYVELGSIDICGKYYVGAVAGVSKGNITNCRVSGAVNGLYYVGGLLGLNGIASNVRSSSFAGIVNGSSHIGGIVGDSYGGVIYSYAEANVTGTSSVGGLVGSNMNIIMNCYSTGDVTGGDAVGGLVGSSYEEISYSYATGHVTGSTYVGGLLGSDHFWVTQCYYDRETTRCSDTGKGTPKSTSEMMTQSTFAGWDLTNTWWMVDGKTRPFLRMGWSRLVNSSHQLQMMAMDLGASYTLGRDIDLSADMANNASMWGTNLASGAGFAPIGTNVNRFLGSFDGKGHNITGLVIDRPVTSYIGLFGCLNTSAKVVNTTLRSSDIKGQSYIGGLAGWNDQGAVYDCSVTGTITGLGHIGGIVGKNRGIISNCSSEVTESAVYDYVGGVVGYGEYSTLTDCHASGNLDGRDSIGGLVGYMNSGTVANCTSTGNTKGTQNVGGLVGYMIVGTASNCSTTGNTTGAGNVGGLIGCNDKTTVSDCHTGGTATGSGDYVGGLIGVNSGRLTDCRSQGKTRGNDIVGGLIGMNSGIISNCYATGYTSGVDGIGGLLGANSNVVSNCFATGNVTGRDYIGGLMGANYELASNCSASGNATGRDYVGGLSGYNYECAIFNCSAKGNVTGSGNILGGFMGDAYTSIVSNNYATGKVVRSSGSSTFIGGFIGWNFQSKIYNCYSLGSVEYAGSANPTDKGFAGNIEFGSGYDMSGNFWNNKTSRQNSTSGDATGHNTSDMKEYLLFHFAKWDFMNIWAIKSGHTYPYFRWEHVNDAPVAMGDHFVTTEDEVLCISSPGVVENDIDPDLFSPSPDMRDTLMVLNNDDLTDLGGTVIMASNGSFIYTPNASLTALAIGEFVMDTFTYTITDGKMNDTATVQINVTGVNDPPVITSTAITVVMEDTDYLLPLNATDTDTGEVLTWTMLAGPAWLGLNTTTMVLKGTPKNADIGSYRVSLKVSDLVGANDTLDFMLTVTNTNDAPVWTTVPGIQNVTEGSPIFLDAMAADEDGDDITYDINSMPACNITMNTASGAIRWLNATEGVYDINLTASDGAAVIWHTFTITVNAIPPVIPPVNHLPVIDPIADQTSTVGEPFTLALTGSDADLEDLLTFTMASAPAGMMISAGGAILWVPANTQVGNHLVTVSLSDGKNATTVDFKVMVAAAPGGNTTTPGTNITVVDKDTDTDKDGMPDIWEQYYGLDPKNASDAKGDKDGDNITNLDEYKGGTSPTKSDKVVADDDVVPDDDVIPDDDVGDDTDDDTDDDTTDAWAANNWLYVLVAIAVILLVIIGVMAFMMSRKKEGLSADEDKTAEEDASEETEDEEAEETSEGDMEETPAEEEEPDTKAEEEDGEAPKDEGSEDDKEPKEEAEPEDAALEDEPKED